MQKYWVCVDRLTTRETIAELFKNIPRFLRSISTAMCCLSRDNAPTTLKSLPFDRP
ncbi:MAG: hypothetical protein SWY16_25690 [Cyanobacteriota bacterium]|nr:hypothetical protein [Cyanobacteriota bacterium]